MAPDRAFALLASRSALLAAPALVAAAMDEVCLSPRGALHSGELWAAVDRRLAAQRAPRVLGGPIPRQPKVVSDSAPLQAFILHALHGDPRFTLRADEDGGAVVTARRFTRAQAFGVSPHLPAGDAAALHVLRHVAAA
jgi:hypothetical protein